MSEGKIRKEKDGHIGRVIFDNPARHNAVSKAMWDALADTIEDFEADDDVRIVVLQGAGERAFVAGADISKFEGERANVDGIKAYGVSVNRGYGAVQNAAKPTIAMIRGYCYGGGCGIAICCDLRICSDNSSFCIPAAKLGVGYGYDNLNVLVGLVGPAFAKEIFYTGRRFSAEEALTMGLVNRMLPESDLGDYVQGYADTIASNAPLSVRCTNLMVNEIMKEADLRDMDLCDGLVEDCSKSIDQVEGRNAFMEKRKPVFVGR